MNQDHEPLRGPLSRRDFLKASAASGVGIWLAGQSSVSRAQSTPHRRRHANVGVGIRSQMHQDAIGRTYAEHCEMVALCDTNEGRLRLAQQRMRRMTDAEVPVYSAGDFDRMIAETRPDVVIVTTVDGFHHEYIIRAMEAGCDVITEKPLTTTAEKCQAIVDAQRRTGRKCTVAFNYRYSPPRSQVKDLLMNGVIGDILSVDFHWMLNTHHGADYFRRWHSQMAMSGGLMVHKATHHFDLVNWWLSAIPVSVMATGKREFYTPQMARRFGLQSHHERCLTCPEKGTCTFYMDLAGSRSLRELYLDNEQYDGYFRDRCVFRPDIDINDTMNVLVRYDNGATMSYSLNAFNSWEGYHIVFNGTKGRLEHTIEESICVSGTDTVQGGAREGGTRIRIMPLRGPLHDIEPWSGQGAHAGGDGAMLDDLFFLPQPPEDPYRRAADHRGGAYSILTGIAANLCFEEPGEIRIADLVSGLDYPVYTSMPTREDPVPMPGTATIWPPQSA